MVCEYVSVSVCAVCVVMGRNSVLDKNKRLKVVKSLDYGLWIVVLDRKQSAAKMLVQ